MEYILGDVKRSFWLLILYHVPFPLNVVYVLKHRICLRIQLIHRPKRYVFFFGFFVRHVNPYAHKSPSDQKKKSSKNAGAI